MEIFNSLEEIRDISPTVTALGNFDGVHKGHQELIRRTLYFAEAADLKSAVFTFSNHPRNLMGNHPVQNIIYAEEKAAIIEKLGIDYLFNIPFTDEIRRMPPSVFIDRLLIECFQMKEGCCGFNYRFGYRAAGTPQVLMEEGLKKGFGLHVLEPYKIDGQIVSSTLIRTLIETGEVDQCARYMGRNYAIEGEVVIGNRLGRTIGFPTSNLNIDEGMVSPPNGVYITQCFYNGTCYPSITNVGKKPTIGEYRKNVETHIFNFDRELYGRRIRVEFLKKLRDERRFDSVEALSAEIAENCVQAREYHRQRGAL